jgi:hypothetical protein
MNCITFIRAATITTALLLSGCADPPRNYASRADDAKVIFRTVNTQPVFGLRMTADYSISSEARPCEGFESVGVVRDGSKTEVPYKDKLLPWVVKAGEKLIKFDDQINWIPVERQAAVSGGTFVQVKGSGHWVQNGSRGACGPLMAIFHAEKANAYVVEIVWNHIASCSMRIADITLLEHPKAVTSRPFRCTRGD